MEGVVKVTAKDSGEEKVREHPACMQKNIVSEKENFIIILIIFHLVQDGK